MWNCPYPCAWPIGLLDKLCYAFFSTSISAIKMYALRKAGFKGSLTSRTYPNERIINQSSNVKRLTYSHDIICMLSSNINVVSKNYIVDHLRCRLKSLMVNSHTVLLSLSNTSVGRTLTLSLSVRNFDFSASIFINLHSICWGASISKCLSTILHLKRNRYRFP